MKNVKKGFELPQDEIAFLEEKTQALQGLRHYELRNRIRGVLFVGRDKMRNGDAAKKCKVHVRTLRDWLARYRADGYAGLQRKEVSGRPAKLDERQQEELIEIMKDGPEKAGYDTGIWTAALVGEVIQKRFGVKYSVKNIQKILKKLGFSFKMPKKNLQEQALKPGRNGWIGSCQRFSRELKRSRA